MATTITYDDPNLAKGTVVHVTGIGALSNGKPLELDEGTEAFFRYLNGYTVQEINNPLISVVTETTKQAEEPAKTKGGK